MKQLLLLLSFTMLFVACVPKSDETAQIGSSPPINGIVSHTLMPVSVPVRDYNPKIRPYLMAVIVAINQNVVDYNYQTMHRCNVGLVAQAALNMTGYELYRDVQKLDLGDNPSWRKYITLYSGVNNKPAEGLLGRLQNVGVTNADIASLEQLSDPYIRHIAKLPDDVKPYDVYAYLEYLKAWVKAIDQQEIKSSVTKS